MEVWLGFLLLIVALPVFGLGVVLAEERRNKPFDDYRENGATYVPYAPINTIVLKAKSQGIYTDNKVMHFADPVEAWEIVSSSREGTCQIYDKGTGWALEPTNSIGIFTKKIGWKGYYER
mgnify:CR=1 FL=1